MIVDGDVQAVGFLHGEIGGQAASPGRAGRGSRRAGRRLRLRRGPCCPPATGGSGRYRLASFLIWAAVPRLRRVGSTTMIIASTKSTVARPRCSTPAYISSSQDFILAEQQVGEERLEQRASGQMQPEPPISTAPISSRRTPRCSTLKRSGMIIHARVEGKEPAHRARSSRRCAPRSDRPFRRSGAGGRAGRAGNPRASARQGEGSASTASTSRPASA